MARDFDGVNDLVNFGDLANLDGLAALTVHVFFNYDVTNQSQAILTKLSAAQTAGWSIQMADDSWSVPATAQDMSFFARNAGVKGGFTEGLALAAGVWHSAGLVFDGSLSGDANRLKAWVNGVQRTLNFSVFPNIPATIEANAGGVCIGWADLSAEIFFNGKVAEASAWNRVLTEAEIQALALGKSPKKFPVGLLFYARLSGANSPEPCEVPNGTSGIVTQALRAPHPDVIPLADSIHDRVFFK